jgi:hypothetical protein
MARADDFPWCLNTLTVSDGWQKWMCNCTGACYTGRCSSQPSGSGGVVTRQEIRPSVVLTLPRHVLGLSRPYAKKKVAHG